MLAISSIDARNRFDQLLDLISQEPVAITQHGQTVAFVVSPQDMADLQDVEARRIEAVKRFELFFDHAETAKSSDMRTAARQLSDADVVTLIKDLR